jgi:hypothetical protein
MKAKLTTTPVSRTTATAVRHGRSGAGAQLLRGSLQLANLYYAANLENDTP